MIKKNLFLILLTICTTILIVIYPLVGVTQDITNNRTAFSGGEGGTVFKKTQTAFAQPIRKLDRKRRRIFAFGDHLFNTQWVQAPSTVSTLDGLGPLFNRTSCAGCHLRDGKGRPPIGDEKIMLSKLIRLSIPGKGIHGEPLPHPSYGAQLQEQAILGVKAEGQTKVSWQEEAGKFADGSSFSLRRPSYQFENLAYGEFGDDIMISARIAPVVFGLALLENIPQENILKNADPDDTNNDGISGRPNYVWDINQRSLNLGRFGLKANEPTLKQQIAGAFNGDMGITTTIFPKANCNSTQLECQKETAFGEQPEVSDKFLEKITTYMRLLGVPARRNLDGKQEQLGERIFAQAQCAVCHLPRQLTGTDSEHAEFNNQVIHPYTDLLLHDMGEDLADNRPDFEANGKEWRTPPLWGIGLVEIVNKHSFFLHDGRARNLMEAILWHGGEAQQSKEFVQNLPQEERDALIAFLNSL